MLSAGTVGRIQEIVGKDGVRTEEESLIWYACDATRFRSLPDLVAKPRDTEQVSKIVALAYAEGVPVTPRGGGTGLTGGAVPAKGGVVVSTERMNSPALIQKEDLYAVVEPGVVTGELQKQVEGKGLFYPPDPASREVCTIGGNVAECAGGLRGLKYGNTKNYVLGLEIVTPEGKVVRTGARTVKSVAGYDVTRLMVGSEGTLGIITQVVLRLLPLPAERRLIWCRLPDVVLAAEAAVQLMGEGLMPSALEIMDQTTVRAVGDYSGKDMGSGVSLLIEFDGTTSVCREDASRALEMLKARPGSEVEDDIGDQDGRALWKARRSVLPALTRLAPTVIIEDVTLPRSKQPEMAAMIGKIANEYRVKVALFGHAGHGNMHPTFLTDRTDADQMERVQAAIGQVMRECVDLGGTVSGERGIGLGKLPFLKLELGGAGYDIMRRLKASLDPKDIMNPGKMFYDS